jgi:HEAT repeat protein
MTCHERPFRHLDNESAVRARLRQVDGQTRKAIETIGTNGLDTLLTRLQSRDSRPRRFIHLWEYRLGLLDAGGILIAEQRRGQAIEAFYRLGDKARPAIPALLKLTHDANPMTRSAAKFALGGVARSEARALQEEYDRNHRSSD